MEEKKRKKNKGLISSRFVSVFNFFKYPFCNHLMFFFFRTCSGTLNELKKEDISNDDDVPLSRKARMIIDDDDIPLAKKLKTMRNIHGDDDDDDDVPLSQKAKVVVF